MKSPLNAEIANKGFYGEINSQLVLTTWLRGSSINFELLVKN